MANILKSMVSIKGNDEVIKLVDSLVDKIDVYVEDGNESIPAFSKAFYENVELGENGGVMNSWSSDNLGSKWVRLYDVSGDGEFSIESAWYPPKEFFIHLYNLCFVLDEDVEVEVTYGTRHTNQLVRL